MGSADAQGALWGAAARDWADLAEPGARPLWGAVLDAVDAQTGVKLLDAGCGAGGASVEAARRGCQVTGVDASAPLLAIARQRLPAGRFIQGDLEALPLGEREVHVAIAVNSVFFCSDPALAVRELGRVVRTGGRVALTSWGPRERCDMAQVFGAMASWQPPPPAGSGPFAYAQPGALESLLEQAGLRVRARGETACPFSYPDLPTAWRAQASSGAMQAALRGGSPDRLRLAVERALLAFKTIQGPIRLNNLFVWVTATKS